MLDDVGTPVHAESTEATTFRDDPLALRRLDRLFRNLSGAALTEDDTQKLIERLEKETV
ncbi:Scr1 family TA system antitoxin-like transcriptional regulator [Streptomyces sparsogenes]|uniref:Scr1 family TA system antitoxin-like transcriptional regulator n=1 Tax=Streptomyces sparsogenes TaxID=67365 RepID=UPI0033FCCACA